MEVVVWDGRGTPPAGIERTQFWVPKVEDEGDLPTIFAAMPQLEVMQLTSAGVENLVGRIPDSVSLCTARGVHGPAVAELVLLLILASQRRLPHFQDAQRVGHWDLVEGDDLGGKRVVIIGAGNLGHETAKRLTGFAAVPIFVGPKASDGVHALSELPELLPTADVVVLTLPLSDESAGMVDAAFLARLPDGALLINVSRGPIVDTDALLAELTSGRLRAGLDVFDPEPLPDGHPLWTAPNLIITPHAAGHVKQAGPRAFALVRDQLHRYLSGEPLQNVISGKY